MFKCIIAIPNNNNRDEPITGISINISTATKSISIAIEEFKCSVLLVMYSWLNALYCANTALLFFGRNS